MATARKLCRITGRVQGVGYRIAAYRKALALDLHGSVKNLPDGRVECEIQGATENVDAMTAWLWQGPPAARVDAVQCHSQAVTDKHGFRIDG